MSELYFENVIEKGNLYLDHILYEFEDEPILFLCKDKDLSLIHISEPTDYAASRMPSSA